MTKAIRVRYLSKTALRTEVVTLATFDTVADARAWIGQTVPRRDGRLRMWIETRKQPATRSIKS